MRCRPLLIAGVACGLLAWPSAATADATAFIGVNTTPSNRTTTGLAVGITVLVIGIEFEYASTREDLSRDAPALRTGMGNLLVQTPVAVSGLQFYGTAGAGFYRERLEPGHQETNVGVNLGGGVKMSLLGPLRLRLDYRVFSLRGSALHTRPQRIYAGLNLSF